MALVASLTIAMAACGGGGGKGNQGNNNPPPPAAPVSVSGTASYEYPGPRANCNGLDFANTQTVPIRGATVQLLNHGTGAEIVSTTSADDGSYVFNSVSANTNVRVRVRAELKQAGNPGWDVEVRDNYVAGGSDNNQFPPAGLSTRPLYAADSAAFSTGTTNQTRNLVVETGWDGNAYTGDRAAAPFAILDTIYAAIRFVRAADPNAHFPPLDAFWSVNNTFASNGVDITAGELSTSSYYPSIDSLFILGDATIDTDEFDRPIVAHEWGHYFEDNFSWADSFGGSHFLGESLLPPMAFSEGFAFALGSMLLDDPMYCDTGVPGTMGGGGFNFEGPSIGTRGWFNEVSVTALIYDLWDTAADGADTGSIGVAPIYDAMIGPHRFSESQATVFSFAAGLRSSLNAQGQALLDALLDREDIVSGAALDEWATNETNDAGLPVDVVDSVLPVYVDYTAGDPPIEVCVDSFLDSQNRHGNNVGEDRFLRITVPIDDQYDVSVVTTTATPPTADSNDRDQSDPDIYLYDGSIPAEIARGWEGTENFEPTFRTPTLFAARTYVARVEEWRFDDAEAAPSYPRTICFDVSLAPTP